jgi:Tfp pilus assembly protein PilN
MVKINLLPQKKSKPINIPFGWIFVVAYAIVACVGLYFVNGQREDDIEKKKAELEERKNEVKKVKMYTDQKNAKKKELDTLQRNKNEYERILNQTSGGGWTSTLLLFEEVLVEAKTIWLRDLRIEGDGRVQINGLSKDNGKKRVVFGITSLLEAFKKKETQFKSVRLKRVTWEAYRDQTVATFELQCVLNRY